MQSSVDVILSSVGAPTMNERSEKCDNRHNGNDSSEANKEVEDLVTEMITVVQEEKIEENIEQNVAYRETVRQDSREESSVVTSSNSVRTTTESESSSDEKESSLETSDSSTDSDSFSSIDSEKHVSDQVQEVMPQVLGLVTYSSSDSEVIEVTNGGKERETKSRPGKQENESSESRKRRKSKNEEQHGKHLEENSGKASAERRTKYLARKDKDLKVKGDLHIEDLPRIDRLSISVTEDMKMIDVGCVSSIVDTLVVVQGARGVPAFDEGTVFFLAGACQALGKVFEVFGPVSQPLYSVRFNSSSEIREFGIRPGLGVKCAHDTPELTNYVLLPYVSSQKGSDASGKDDCEIPAHQQEFSDDEEERRCRAKNRVSTDESTATAESLSYRTHACTDPSVDKRSRKKSLDAVAHRFPNRPQPRFQAGPSARHASEHQRWPHRFHRERPPTGGATFGYAPPSLPPTTFGYAPPSLPAATFGYAPPSLPPTTFGYAPPSLPPTTFGYAPPSLPATTFGYAPPSLPPTTFGYAPPSLPEPPATTFPKYPRVCGGGHFSLLATPPIAGSSSTWQPCAPPTNVTSQQHHRQPQRLFGTPSAASCQLFSVPPPPLPPARVPPPPLNQTRSQQHQQQPLLQSQEPPEDSQNKALSFSHPLVQNVTWKLTK